MAKNPQHDWRDSGNESAPESTGSRPWQPGDDAHGDPSGLSRRTVKRTIALVSLIGIAIIIGVVFVMMRPIKPACLVLAGSGYETNLLLPHNAHGWNGLYQLQNEVAERESFTNFWRMPWDQPTKMRQVGDRPIEVEDQGWKTLWDKLDIPSYNESTVVVFLSMHGMADDKEAYLLPNLPSKLALKSFDSSRIPFREVFDTLQAVTNKNIVLILDVSHVQSHWPIGMLHNDFVQRLQDEYADKINQTPHLTVICSASPKQRSWASDELQQTAFSYYVTQGLKGGGHRARGNVNALSLFNYVAEKVDTWAQTNRARNQTPILLGGKERAEKMALVHIGDEYEEKTPAATDFAADKLRGDWKQWESLKTEHAPHVHSPHLWRLYQETLLRYEQLLRAGDPTAKAAELKKNLAALSSEIAVSRSLTGAFKSLGSSFPMPQVLGFPIAEEISDQALRAFLNDLRKTDNLDGQEEEKDKLFKRYRERNIQERQFIQLKLSQMILKEMNQLPKAQRDREQARLVEIEREFRAAQRPTEVHLLKMFLDANPAVNDETLKLALHVRLLAEEAAMSARSDSAGELYSEVIFRWIRDEVNEADKLRRDGEDHLFGDPKAHGGRALEKLEEAKKAYGAVREKAQKLQTAMALRDEVSAELPFIAAWLALPHRNQNKEAVQAQRAAAELLGNRLAVLNRDLDEADRKMPHPTTVSEIGDELHRLREAYHDNCEKLKIGVGLQQNWHGIDAALSVPPMDTRDVGLRLALLSKQRDISGQLIKNTAPEGRTEEEELPALRVERDRKLFQAAIKSMHEMRVADKENVDDKVRDFFFKLPGEILAKSELTVERSDLVAATAMCRLIPGAFVDFVKDEAKKRVNPVDRLRRLNMGRMLHWQAKRSLEDHWFEPGENKNTPYYDGVAKSYLTSASGLFDEGQMPDSLRNEATEVEKKLAFIKLNVPKIEKIFWTTQGELTFAFQVKPEPGLPKGTPMVWLQVAKKGQAAEKGKVWPRKAIDPWTKPADSYLLDNSSFTGGGELVFHLHVYYRGQHIYEAVPAERSQPNVIVKHTPALKENTKLAVRMDSTFDYGAIAILLDNSGSMDWRHPKEGNNNVVANRNKKPPERRRFDYALDALDQVLRGVPEKTYLSVLTFDDDRTTAMSFRPSTPWLKEDLGTLRKRLEGIKLGGGSPIAQATIKTMADGFPRAGFKGPKVIVVLTDGSDSSSIDAGGRKTNAQIAQELKEAGDIYGDVAVVVVCFIDKEVDAGEYKSASEQFGGVRQFQRKGAFQDVSKGGDLGNVIEALIRPRVQLWDRAEQNVIAEFKNGVPINYHKDATLFWKQVDPGDYKAKVLQTAPNSSVDVQMLPGQKMFMVLRRRDTDLSLKRAILAYQPESEQRRLPRKEKQDWVVTLMESFVPGTTNVDLQLRQLLTFEKKDINQNPIRQPQPGFAWLELEAATGVKPDTVFRWWRDWNVAAPAYRVQMKDWFPTTQPKVSTWFWPEEREIFLRNRDLLKRESRAVPFLESAQNAADDSAVIEAVDWKETEIEDANGKFVKKECLIVRVRHPQGRPVWVDMDFRAPHVGSEHHYFTNARSCTSYFYGFSKVDRVNLTLMDIPAFKAAAQALDFTPDGFFQAPQVFVQQ
jgi:hypothetical protein